ncbi:hypothetical protein ABKU91_23695, partial (plasmid) [Enterobacter hormaechei]
FSLAENTDDLFVGKTLLHGDVLMWLMKTLLTSRCINQRGAGQLTQKAKTPAEARVINKWCPDSESNQGHGDFQSLQKRPNALSALTVFYWFALRKMFKFAAI